MDIPAIASALRAIADALIVDIAQAAPVKASPAKAAPTEAAPTEAAPTEAAPAQAAPAQAAPTEAAPELTLTQVNDAVRALIGQTCNIGFPPRLGALIGEFAPNGNGLQGIPTAKYRAFLQAARALSDEFTAAQG